MPEQLPEPQLSRLHPSLPDEAVGPTRLALLLTATEHGGSREAGRKLPAVRRKYLSSVTRPWTGTGKQLANPLGLAGLGQGPHVTDNLSPADSSSRFPERNKVQSGGGERRTGADPVSGPCGLVLLEHSRARGCLSQEAGMGCPVYCRNTGTPWCLLEDSRSPTPQCAPGRCPHPSGREWAPQPGVQASLGRGGQNPCQQDIPGLWGYHRSLRKAWTQGSPPQSWEGALGPLCSRWQLCSLRSWVPVSADHMPRSQPAGERTLDEVSAPSTRPSE